MIFARTSLYICTSYLAIYFNNRLYGGSDFSLLSILFLLFFAIELVMPHVVKTPEGKLKFYSPLCSAGQNYCILRNILYAICIIGVITVGCILIHESMKVRATSKELNQIQKGEKL